MALLTERPPRGAETTAPDAGPGRTPWRALIARATSWQALLVAFVVVVLLATGPLQGVDRALHHPWARELTPGLVPFLRDLLDRIAGQRVNLPVLATTAVVLAARRRSWRPVGVALVAEAGFYVVGLLKLLFARPAPMLHDPAFFAGGLGVDGREGISFPSGHAAESVLIYGAVVYLVAVYSSASRRTVTALGVLTAVLVVNAVVVSFGLGYHWFSDLLGGVVTGGLLLRTVVGIDRGLGNRLERVVTHLRA
jgi:membrane-associated phospholipid phosphatase